MCTTGIANGLGVAGRPPLESSTSESRRAAAGVRMFKFTVAPGVSVRCYLVIS